MIVTSSSYAVTIFVLQNTIFVIQSEKHITAYELEVTIKSKNICKNDEATSMLRLVIPFFIYISVKLENLFDNNISVKFMTNLV